MHFRTDDQPGRKALEYAGSAYTLDLVALGQMGSPARHVIGLAGGGGTIWVRYADDWSTAQLELEAGQDIGPDGAYVAELAFGNPAVYTGGAGVFPVVLTGAETLSLRFDQGTPYDSGQIDITPAAGSYTQAQLLALINAAINAAIPPPRGVSQALAADAGAGASSLTSRAAGTGALVDVVAIHATLATGLGWAAGPTSGTAFASPATGVRVIW